MNGKLLASVTRHRIPAIGFVNEGHLCQGMQPGTLARLLNMWLDAGLELGNHSFSHHDVNRTPLARYERDIIRGEAVTRKLLERRGKKLRYFRHPFLHTGREPAARRRLEKFLKERGYQVAPVTLDNQEWVFACAYARAEERRDDATMRRVKEAYIPYMERIFEFFEKLSLKVVGYEPKQILLLHANSLNAGALEELVAMMKRRGYAFISLEQALTDPAYRMADGYSGPQGFSWLHRWAAGRKMEIELEPREPAFVAELCRKYGTE